jgi:cysteine desulfurase
MHVNNEIGGKTDIREISAICRDPDVLLQCDAGQSVGLHVPDVHDLGADLMAGSGHKFYGPKGIGALCVRSGVDLGPLVEGGSQKRERRGHRK